MLLLLDRGLRSQISSPTGLASAEPALSGGGRKGPEGGVCFDSDERWGVRLLTSLTPLSLTVFSGPSGSEGWAPAA